MDAKSKEAAKRNEEMQRELKMLEDIKKLLQDAQRGGPGENKSLNFKLFEAVEKYKQHRTELVTRHIPKGRPKDKSHHPLAAYEEFYAKLVLLPIDIEQRSTRRR